MANNSGLVPGIENSFKKYLLSELPEDCKDKVLNRRQKETAFSLLFKARGASWNRKNRRNKCLHNSRGDGNVATKSTVNSMRIIERDIRYH